MKYLSICSGIEAASVAWHPLCWTPLAFSEIEAFPRAVLQHHYPDVPLHGDFTVLREQEWIVDADVLVGGTPCQAFSVAGLRNSLADDRGNLSLEFVRLADAIDDVRLAGKRDAAIVVWENVPGVLSVKDNAFGCFLAALAGDAAAYNPPRGKWTNAGVVDGPKRKVAWRILDAQYFGLAQRRCRVFVVASAREGFDPAAVLLEFEGVRRDTAPRREARETTTHSIAPSLTSSGRGVERGGDTRGQDPVVAVMEDPVPPLMARSSRGGAQTLSPGHQTDGHMVAVASTGDISHCLNAGGMGRQDYETETLVTHALRGEGFDGSEDGTGRGTPLVPVYATGFYQNQGSHGSGNNDELSPTLKAADSNNLAAAAIAFSCKDSGNDATPCVAVAYSFKPGQSEAAGGTFVTQEFTPTLQAQNNGSTAVPAVAYAFQPRIARNGRGDMGEVVNALNAQSGETGKGDAAPCVATSMQVRRLTVVECSRLQGFPDDYLLSVTWRGKCPPPDGPMYKALGNSMAVPVMRWIGHRIARHLGGEL